MGARFYDPTIARWLSEDPVKGFAPLSLNFYAYFYAYVGNNPLMLTDPTGMCDQACLEQLNRERNQLAMQAIQLAGLTGQRAEDIYVGLREAARAMGFEPVRDWARVAIESLTGTGLLVAGPASVPGRAQVREMYYEGAGLIAGGAALMAIGGLLSGRGDPRGPAIFVLGETIFLHGLDRAVRAREFDLQYYSGEVLKTLDPVTRTFLEMLFRGMGL
jgi:hypothetical protein